jgi:hypothetical protein
VNIYKAVYVTGLNKIFIFRMKVCVKIYFDYYPVLSGGAHKWKWFRKKKREDYSVLPWVLIVVCCVVDSEA